MSFADFCKYVAIKNEDTEALAELFVNYIEPFATETGVDIPDELIVALEAIEADSEADCDAINSETESE